MLSEISEWQRDKLLVFSHRQSTSQPVEVERNSNQS